MHKEVVSQPNKKPKKSGGSETGSVALLENSKQLGCVSQDFGAAEIQVDFTEESNILRTQAQRALLKRYLTPRKNSGKKGSIARCHSAF